MSKREANAIGRTQKPNIRDEADRYSAFDTLDGSHPWQEAVPEGSVLYPVRMLRRGRVLYFNFALAKEMGLLPIEHLDRLTPALERKLLETFAIQIVNEYDRLNGKKIPASDVKPIPFMATRYLQLQHANKQGKTSGDGRSVWNGCVQNNGHRWDVSSRGTGVTQLAPGAVEANRPLRTGDAKYGYGCGLADVDELYGSAVMSEILHWQGIGTERTLCIIDLGKGAGVGVRAAPNLIRPAHLFLFLKQNRRDELRRSCDYLIERQLVNRAWSFNPKAFDRYDCMLRDFARDFARFAAVLERHYVFAWLDWDGDNVLASAGIIDYGSIRQFGLRHDQYRFDDITRLSTNLNEQKDKARLIVQVFAQLVDYVKTGRKRPLAAFKRGHATRLFDKEFERRIRTVFLTQVGLDETTAERVMAQAPSAVERLYTAFSTLERQKTRAKLKRVADGVNRPAVYNMRAVLRELPSMLHNSAWAGGRARLIHAREILRAMQSIHCSRTDMKLKGPLQIRIERFISAYASVLEVARPLERPWNAFLKDFARSADGANIDGRITGNGAEYIVQEIMRAMRKGLPPAEAQKALQRFVEHQIPRAAAERLRQFTSRSPSLLRSSAGDLLQRLVSLAHEHQEDI